MYVSDRRESDDAGNTKLEVVVTNGSGAPCMLSGYPTIAGIPFDDGPVVPLNAQQGTYFGEPEPAEPVVGIDGSVAVYIAGSTSCEAANSGQRQEWFGLEMGLPTGSSMLVATDFDTICGVSVSAFGQPSA
jgi:hypothetical protein